MAVMVTVFSKFYFKSQIAKFMGPTWGPPGSCRPQMGPMLAPLTFLSRVLRFVKPLYKYSFLESGCGYVITKLRNIIFSGRNDLSMFICDTTCGTFSQSLLILEHG